MTPSAGRRRPRAAVWLLAALALAGAAVAIVLVVSHGGGGDYDASAHAAVVSRGGGDDAGARAAIARICTPNTPRSDECPHNAHFDPRPYVSHGAAYQCSVLASQADAQAVLRADPRDPNHFDYDRDGIACPQLPAPRDLTPVASSAARFRCRRSDQRSARCPHAHRRFDPAEHVGYQTDVYDCSQFASQADAQAVLRYQPTDPNKLDSDGDGIACPQLPAPVDRTPVVRKAPS